MAVALEGLCILLVEDDPIIGLDLRQSFEEAGAVVLGPAPDVAGALVLLEQSPVDVGVLDVSIIGGDSLPIADLLSQRGVTFLFHTCHRGGLRNRYPTVPIIDKPSRSSELIKAVQALKARPA
jgi:DNA-binding NarL/FixJ family response regulator